MKSYNLNRNFGIKQEEPYPEQKEINAGIPRGRALGPIFYVLHALEEEMIAALIFDAAVLSVGTDHEETDLGE